MIGMFIKLWDPRDSSQEVSVIIPLEASGGMEAASQLLAEAVLPSLVHKYNLEHTRDICASILAGDYDYTFHRDFVNRVVGGGRRSPPDGLFVDHDLDIDKVKDDLIKTEVLEPAVLVEDNSDMEDINSDRESSSSKLKCHRCDVCYTSFYTKANLRKHTRSVHGDKNYVCDICTSAFTTQYYLTRHLKIHKLESMDLDTGDEENPKSDAVKRETERNLAEEIPEDSPTSTKKRQKQKRKPASELTQGEGGGEERKKQVYVCDINCGKEFPTKLLFRRHQRSEHNEFFCTICVKAYLTSHTCHRPHKCEVCGRGFNNREVLNKHILIHTGEKPHVCETCGKKCRQIASLLSHQKTHKIRPILSCDQCDTTFINESSLKNHKMVHSGEISHICDFCSQKFATRSGLRNHMKRFHTVGKTIVCPVCSKKFAFQHELNYHMESHAETKSHGCDICLTSFYAKEGLRKHMRRVHGEKKYVCNICKSAFSTKYYLTRHMQSHKEIGGVKQAVKDESMKYAAMGRDDPLLGPC